MRAELRATPANTSAGLVKNAVGGLLLGLLLGYAAAWVLPRRRPVREGAYRAPVPERIELPRQIDLTSTGIPLRQRTTSPDLRSVQPEGVG